GLIALITLVALQALSGVIRQTRFGSWLVVNRPVLIMAGPELLQRHMDRCHVSYPELHSRLRQSGVSHPDQVGAVIFESSGTLSVIRRGQPMDPELFREVIGAEKLLESPTERA